MELLAENGIVVDSIQPNLPLFGECFLTLIDEKRRITAMHKLKAGIIFDSWIMFKRCLLTSLRNPEALLVATIVPFFLMFLFGNVFGNIANVGTFNYIDFYCAGDYFTKHRSILAVFGNECDSRYDKGYY